MIFSKPAFGRFWSTSCLNPTSMPSVTDAIGSMWLGIRTRLGMGLTIRSVKRTGTATGDPIGRSFLGLPIGCARCHHHKYDPIKVQD